MLFNFYTAALKLFARICLGVVLVIILWLGGDMLLDATKQRAFSLIEILITIAIISILMAVAAPSYARYTRKAHYTELVNAAAALKLAVEGCYQALGDLQQCNSGNNGIPAAQKKSTGLVALAEVKNGTINITPTAKYGIKTTDTYILQARVKDEHLLWSAAGNGVKNGYV